jgi:thioredoxin-dependent peroxiredoxin
MPEFTLLNQEGNEFAIADFIGKKKLVVYFYPKDDTHGSTTEACYFRDQYETFEETDAMIIGVSSQSVECHNKFSNKYNLNFTLLSDENSKIRKMFGVPSYGIISGRVTFIVDKDGIVSYIFRSQTKAKKHVDEALRILKEMTLHKITTLWI